MNDERPPPGEPPRPAQMVAVAEQLFSSSVAALGVALARVERGEFDKAGELVAACTALRKALALAIQERQSLGKVDTQVDADTHGALDLAAARDEIGRRLARLRAAGDAGGVSGGAE